MKTIITAGEIFIDAVYVGLFAVAVVALVAFFAAFIPRRK